MWLANTSCQIYMYMFIFIMPLDLNYSSYKQYFLLKKKFQMEFKASDKYRDSYLPVAYQHLLLTAIQQTDHGPYYSMYKVLPKNWPQVKE